MRILKFLSILCLSLLSLCSVSLKAFSEDFDADNTASFMEALSRANDSAGNSHTININGDISLDSSVKESISLELQGSDTENHYDFSLNGNTFTFDGADKTSKITDLNIISNADGSGFVINNQDFTITNTDFSGNSASNSKSVLDNRGGNLKISDSNFTEISNRLGGGVINNTSNGGLDITNSLFSKNNGSNGGSIYFSNGVASIDNSRFLNNTASTYGGALYVNGGTLNITNSVISNNIAAASGGALYINGGNVTIDNTSFDGNSVTQASLGGAVCNRGNLVIQNNSSFTNNKVKDGAGGAIINWGTLDIDGTLFDNNSVKNEGGAIDNSGTLSIANSTFTNNKSTDSYGGAIGGGGEIKINNCIFDKNTAHEYGGAISVMVGNAAISDSTFTNNVSESSFGGGAIINYMSTMSFKGKNKFDGNDAQLHGGAIYATTQSTTDISGSAIFTNNEAKDGFGGAIFVQGIFNINANGPEDTIIFANNTDSTGSNAFHLDIYHTDPQDVGTMNLNLSNGAKIILQDNISGIEGTKLNINGTSSYDDHVYLGAANENFKGDVTANNIDLAFYNQLSGLANAPITAVNTHFNFMNGYINNTPLNLNLAGGGNSLSIEVDPAALTADYIEMTGDPANMTQLTIRDINVLSNPIQSVTIFDLFDHEKYGTDLALSEKLQNSTVYGAVKTYKWALTPKLTLIELGGLNPNIQRYQAATAAAFMNQMLSYDYSLNRTDEIYTNLREQKLAARKLNSYASVGPAGMYVDHYYEDGSAMWIRPYVNLETFDLSGAMGSLNNQSYGFMLGFDFPMHETKNDWKLFPTIYASYIGSSQQYMDSHMNQNGGYGGFLLSAYKDDFYAGWTINGGGLGVASRYNAGHDDYAIVTAGTALKVAYNWKFLNRFILQPNFTTAYTFLSPSNLVNFQSVDMNQTQVNGLTIAPSARLTYRNESGYEPYIYGGCVIPLMSDIKATADGTGLDKMTLNAWAQFGAGIRKRISERVTCFAETVIRTGGRSGWGFMLNIQIAI